MYPNRPQKSLIAITIPTSHSKTRIKQNQVPLTLPLKAYFCSTGWMDSSMEFGTAYPLCTVENWLIENLVRTWGSISHSIHYVVFLINLNWGSKSFFLLCLLPLHLWANSGQLEVFSIIPEYLRGRIWASLAVKTMEWIAMGLGVWRDLNDLINQIPQLLYHVEHFSVNALCHSLVIFNPGPRRLFALNWPEAK